jgi:hypothetical protein
MQASRCAFRATLFRPCLLRRGQSGFDGCPTPLPASWRVLIAFESIVGSRISLSSAVGPAACTILSLTSSTATEPAAASSLSVTLPPRSSVVYRSPAASGVMGEISSRWWYCCVAVDIVECSEACHASDYPRRRLISADAHPCYRKHQVGRPVDRPTCGYFGRNDFK